MGGRRLGLWLARVLAVVVLLQGLLTPAPAQALTWHLPGRAAPAPTSQRGGGVATRLQEVPPPDWVQKAQEALEARDPKLRILAPADGSLLPDGPWTLRLQISDWPLVDAGPLGLGPHLVVQLDDEPPRPIVDTEVEMPPLSPGSHLLTVYAAKPWGEAHKSPTAVEQIRVHRLAPNPGALPARGTPQLLAVSPNGAAGDPPLLLDWLLIDAPLQGLRTETLGWRLRVTLNGESVLVERQTPLWLRGWRAGSNALLLELLDGRGEPLNPPFNSLLREVIVTTPSEAVRSPSAPLSPLEMAVLLGEQPLSALFPPAPPPPEGKPVKDELVPEGAAPPLVVPIPNPTAEPSEPLQEEVGAPEPLAHALVENGADVEPEPEMAPEAEPTTAAAPRTSAIPMPEPVPAPASEAEAEPPDTQIRPAPPLESRQAPEPLPSLDPPAASEEESPAPGPSNPSKEVSAGGELPLTAREEVNPDGTLKRPSRPSSLERLLERWKR